MDGDLDRRRIGVVDERVVAVVGTRESAGAAHAVEQAAVVRPCARLPQATASQHQARPPGG